METRLGKITDVKFGIGGYQDAMFGIHFALGSDGWGIGDTWSTWAPGMVDPTEHAKWTENDRREHMADICTRISKLLQSAKKTNVSQLVGVPIEIVLNGNSLESWRILTEVL